MKKLLQRSVLLLCALSIFVMSSPDVNACHDWSAGTIGVPIDASQPPGDTVGGAQPLNSGNDGSGLPEVLCNTGPNGEATVQINACIDQGPDNALPCPGYVELSVGEAGATCGAFDAISSSLINIELAGATYETWCATMAMTACPGRVFEFDVQQLTGGFASVGSAAGSVSTDICPETALYEVVLSSTTCEVLNQDEGEFNAPIGVIYQDSHIAGDEAPIDVDGDARAEVVCGTQFSLDYQFIPRCVADVAQTYILEMTDGTTTWDSGRITEGATGTLVGDIICDACVTYTMTLQSGCGADLAGGAASWTFEVCGITSDAGEITVIDEAAAVANAPVIGAGDGLDDVGANFVDNVESDATGTFVCWNDQVDLTFDDYVLYSCNTNDDVHWGWSATSGWDSGTGTNAQIATAGPAAPFNANFVNDGTYPLCAGTYVKPYLADVNGIGGDGATCGGPEGACYDEGAEVELIMLERIEITVDVPANTCENVIISATGGMNCYDAAEQFTVGIYDDAGNLMVPAEALTVGGTVQFNGDPVNGGVPGEGPNVVGASNGMVPGACGGSVPGSFFTAVVYDSQGCERESVSFCVEVCCITDPGFADWTGFAGNTEHCVGEPIGPFDVINQGPTYLNAGLEGSLYETGFLLLDITAGTFVNYYPGLSHTFNEDVGCYQVYSYNFNNITGPAGADWIGLTPADLDAGIVAASGACPTAIEASALCELGACYSYSPSSEFYIYPDIVLGLEQNDPNGDGYSITCNTNDDYGIINDGSVNMTLEFGGATDNACFPAFPTQFDLVWTGPSAASLPTTLPGLLGNPSGPLTGTFSMPADLLPGVYCAVVQTSYLGTQTIGCETEICTIVAEPPVITCGAVATDVSCPLGTVHTDGPDPDGTITPYGAGGVQFPSPDDYLVTVYDAAGAIVYQGLGGTATGLDEGLYDVTVEDANGCGCETSAEIFRPEPFTTAGAVANAEEGYGGNILPVYYNHHEINVSGGTPPYAFDFERTGYVRWDVEASEDPAFDTQLNITYADNAEWSVTIIDGNGCTTDCLSGGGDATMCFTNDDGNAAGTGTVGQGTGDILDIDAFEIMGESYGSYTAGLQSGDGAIDITMAGCGGGPYTYAWTGPGNFTAATEDISGLESGHYEVVVTCGNQTTSGWYWVPLDRRSGRLKAGAAKIDAFPNPFADSATIEFTVEEDGLATIEIISMDGKVVEQSFSAPALANQEYSTTIDGSDLVAGIYIVQLTTESGFSEQIRISLVK